MSRYLTPLLFGLPVFGLSGSFFSQHVLGWEPCPLCILQRLALLAIVLLLAFVKLWPRTAAALISAFGAAGASVGAYQSFMLTQPPSLECGGSVSYYLWILTSDYPFLEVLLQANGNCQDATYALAGVPLPVLSTVLLAGISTVALLKALQPPIRTLK